jgi:hypothetical protein
MSQEGLKHQALDGPLLSAQSFGNPTLTHSYPFEIDLTTFLR